MIFWNFSPNLTFRKLCCYSFILKHFSNSNFIFKSMSILTINRSEIILKRILWNHWMQVRLYYYMNKGGQINSVMGWVINDSKSILHSILTAESSQSSVTRLFFSDFFHCDNYHSIMSLSKCCQLYLSIWFICSIHYTVSYHQLYVGYMNIFIGLVFRKC